MANDTLIQEVDEELRRDRIRKAWRDFGPYVIGAAVAVVLLVAFYEGWNWYQNSIAAKSSDQFYTAIEAAEGTDVAAAQDALNKVIAEGTGGYPALAQFRQAALLAHDGKPDEAIAAYDALGNSPINGHLRDLAQILAANLLIDKGDVAQVQQRVAGLLTPDSPLHNAAFEALGLTQYKARQLDDALDTFDKILADPGIGQDMAQRVGVFKAQVMAEGGKSKLAPPPDAPADISAEPSAAPSTGLDASTEMDVTPPVSEPAASSAPEVSAEPQVSSAPEMSSVPEMSSAPEAPSEPAPSSAPAN